MQVLVAPDAFTGTLSAVEAAEAIARGWSRRAPRDTLVTAPMADGGPGFVDVLHTALGGELCAVTVAGPHRAPTPVTLLRHDGTVYLEAAQACGMHLVASGHDAESAPSTGVGEALDAALRMGPDRIVVGLGGSATNDGGAGMLGALGAVADVPLAGGPAGFEAVQQVDLTAVLRKFVGVELVVATDVDTVLLGMFGTTRSYGAHKGLDESAVQRVDAALDRFVVAALGPAPAERRVADAPGAGAGGGLGFGLMLLGGEARSGIGLVAEATDLPGRARASDLVVTGEGSFDFSSRAGKVVHGVGQVAAEAVRPCIVLAGTVLVGSREMRAMGIEAAYSVEEHLPGAPGFTAPADGLAALAERVARTWSH